MATPLMTSLMMPGKKSLKPVTVPFTFKVSHGAVSVAAAVAAGTHLLDICFCKNRNDAKKGDQEYCVHFECSVHLLSASSNYRHMPLSQ